MDENKNMISISQDEFEALFIDSDHLGILLDTLVNAGKYSKLADCLLFDDKVVSDIVKVVFPITFERIRSKQDD